MNKEAESSELLESLKFRITTVIAKIEDIRYSINEIEEEITEISQVSDSLSDLVDAEDE